MFTEHDVKSIFSLFPPHTSADFIPQFAIASSGNGFVTLQFAQAQFRSRVTKGSSLVLFLLPLTNPICRDRTNLSVGIG